MNCSPQSSFIASVAFDQIRKLPQLFMKIDLNLYVFIRLIEMNWFILTHENKILNKEEPSLKVSFSHQRLRTQSKLEFRPIGNEYFAF